MATTRTREWTIAKVMDLSKEQAIELWRTLPAADIQKMNGEFCGLVPNPRDEEARKRTAEVMFNESSVNGYWLGKAYRPTGDNKGEGYNHWRKLGGKVVRNLRFGTEMGTSLIDGKPSLIMRYGDYNVGNTLVDEIRQLDDNLYIGAATTELPDGSRTVPGHFALAGPIGEWSGPDADWDKWTIERLMRMGRPQIIALWKTLPAVDMRELDGEYAGLVPNARDPEAKKRIDDFMYDEDSERGYWLGKAYKAADDTKGEGYNHWRMRGGNVVRNGRFATEMGTSLIDGKPSFLMHYSAFKSDTTLVDEIRKLTDGLYIGAASTEAADGSRTAPAHFVLVGPKSDWVGHDE